MLLNCSVRISDHFLLIYVALVSLYYVSCHDITLQTLQGHHATADVIESWKIQSLDFEIVSPNNLWVVLR